MSGFADWARQLPPALAVLIVSGLPVVELRGAIPLGVWLGLSPAQAGMLALIGNLVPAPLVLAALVPVSRWLEATRLGPWVWRLHASSRARAGLVNRYGVLGLALFVGVPLPGTGVWTGAAVAAVLGLPFGRSLLALTVGAGLAAVAVTTLTAFGVFVFR